jgi:hypothetical protein
MAGLARFSRPMVDALTSLCTTEQKLPNPWVG